LSPAIRGVEDLPDVPEFVRGNVHRYESPEFGWSVPYYKVGLTATVYFYPCPSPAVAEGDMSGKLAAEFESARNEILSLRGGFYREVAVLAQSPARVDATALGPGTLHQSFSVRRDEGAMFSELILAILGGQYVKLRCTYTPIKERGHGQAINSLLAVLGEACGGRQSA